MSQKFCNILDVREAFAEIGKVTKHTGFWDAELAWYSLSATHCICRGLKLKNQTRLWDAELT